ncbi:MAG: GNAT family N-acetyltransferase [Ruminococcaceae bacterium]|nr:GNAT family N-acetyltransferase [Oscillospiraceae bacterium]
MALCIKHGSKKSLPLMKALWKDTFHDSDEFIETFFEKFYRPRKTLLLFDGKELVSMLFYMDVGMKYFRRRIKCAYLYGVATRLDERRRGHFSRLHGKLIEELTDRKYDAVLVLPASENLFGFYKNYGYTHSLKRFEYELLTLDITEVKDLKPIWEMKKEIFKKSKEGLKVLESEEQFMESRKGHKFFSSDSAYLAFAPKGDKFILYEVISYDRELAKCELIHYERSASLLDLTGKLDPEQIEKQKPQLSYLLN